MKAIFFLLPLSVIAQEILPDVVVTANRNTEEAKEVPYTLEILTAEDLLENATRTLPQAFQNTPSVLVQQTTTGHGSPYIRGFTGRQNLLLQDGIRLNNSTWRNGPVQYWNTLDAQAIDRLELIKSQGSVLFGSDAIGGTVNTFSKSSNFRQENGPFSGGNSRSLLALFFRHLRRAAAIRLFPGDGGESSSMGSTKESVYRRFIET